MVSPTGYQLLVAAGASLTGIAIFAADTEPSDGDITDFLIANHGVLERGRHALQQECAVPLEYDAGFSQKQGDNFRTPDIPPLIPGVLRCHGQKCFRKI